MKKLTKKQSALIEFIKKFIFENGFSPTYKEIALSFKINVNAVHQQVLALEKKGYIERSDKLARSIRLKLSGHSSAYRYPLHMHGSGGANTITIPLYGNVAAGEPIFAEDNIEGYLTAERPQRARGELFAVTVRGDSMEDKQILEKDKLIIRKQNTANDGDIVVALLDDEVTVKIFRKKGGKPYLQPANSKYKPIYSPFKILGIVVGLTRDYTLT